MYFSLILIFVGIILTIYCFGHLHSDLHYV